MQKLKNTSNIIYKMFCTACKTYCDILLSCEYGELRFIEVRVICKIRYSKTRKHVTVMHEWKQLEMQAKIISIVSPSSSLHQNFVASKSSLNCWIQTFGDF